MSAGCRRSMLIATISSKSSNVCRSTLWIARASVLLRCRWKNDADPRHAYTRHQTAAERVAKASVAAAPRAICVLARTSGRSVERQPAQDRVAQIPSFEVAERPRRLGGARNTARARVRQRYCQVERPMTLIHGGCCMPRQPVRAKRELHGFQLGRTWLRVPARMHAANVFATTLARS